MIIKIQTGDEINVTDLSRISIYKHLGLHEMFYDDIFMYRGTHDDVHKNIMWQIICNFKERLPIMDLNDYGNDFILGGNI